MMKQDLFIQRKHKVLWNFIRLYKLTKKKIGIVGIGEVGMGKVNIKWRSKSVT